HHSNAREVRGRDPVRGAPRRPRVTRRGVSSSFVAPAGGASPGTDLASVPTHYLAPVFSPLRHWVRGGGERQCSPSPHNCEAVRCLLLTNEHRPHWRPIRSSGWPCVFSSSK